MRAKNKTVAMLEDALPEKIAGVLRSAGKLAGERGLSVYVVGGLVRDLIMGAANLDIDLVVEGDAIAFSREFARRWHGTLLTHGKFGTATVVMPWGIEGIKRFKVDLATARREHYGRPAALPTVMSSSLRNDLYRRDFTINAMAVSLNRDDYGRLIDPFGGRRHLEAGVISVLHEWSFIDDPTRIFRAVRFQARFGFRIEPRTERLIKHAINENMLKRTSHERIRNELVLILKEEDPYPAVRKMDELCELRFIHPKMRLDRGSEALFKSVADSRRWYRGAMPEGAAPDVWLIYLMVLLERLDLQETREMLVRFAFRRLDREKVLCYKKEGAKALRFFSKKGASAPSLAYRALRGLATEAVLLIMAKTASPRGRKAIKGYLAGQRRMRIRTNGSDLEKIGFLRGPGIGRAIEEILCARIDGKVKTKGEEFSLASKILKRGS